MIDQQIWIKDHLRIVAPPIGPKYNPSNYRMRRNVIILKSVDAWSYWMLELGSDDILWYVPWYQMGGVLRTSYNESRVYLLGFTHSTWYSVNRVMRQTGNVQPIPVIDGGDFDAPLSAGVVRTVLSAWRRDHGLVHPLTDPSQVQVTPEYRHWLKTEIWPMELPRKIALLRHLEKWDEEIPAVIAEKVRDKAEETLAKDEKGKGKIEETLATDTGTEEMDSPEREYAPRRKRGT